LFRNVWGFTALPGFSKDDFDKMKSEEDSKRIPLKANKIIGIDIDQKAINGCRDNFKQIGINVSSNFDEPNTATLLHADFRNIELPFQVPLVVCNPPYGERLKIDDLPKFYLSLGYFIKKNVVKDGQAVIITDERNRIGLIPTEVEDVRNGGLSTTMSVYKMENTI